MQCRFCDQELKRENWCHICEKPQLNASDVIWTDKTCRQCYVRGGVVLDEKSPFCYDCRILITSNDLTKQVEKSTNDGIVHKQIRWLQSWFFHDGVTSNSAYLYWRAPKYKNQEFKVGSYLILITDSSDSYLVNGNQLSYKLINLYPSQKYSIKLTALTPDGEVIKTSLKTQFVTARSS